MSKDHSTRELYDPMFSSYQCKIFTTCFDRSHPRKGSLYSLPSTCNFSRKVPLRSQKWETLFSRYGKELDWIRVCPGCDFIPQMRLSDISSSSLEDRRGYLTIAVISKREGKLLLRRTEGIKEMVTTSIGFIIILYHYSSAIFYSYI